ncbi:MAG: biotin--[acetyl-CoA-carboxylase] ligase [Candidatus Devosia symbiotica]|nr:biotin--[acetyl-CoA-carboxylase] ligase [Candidatus Devosia symbiotica]
MSDFSLGPKARAAGYRLCGFDSVGSTNSEALAAAAAGDPGGIWFAARQQMSGRGRRGRHWESPHGNLAATLLIVPDCDPTLLATLGFVAGVSLSRGLSAILPGGLVRIDINGANDLGGQSRIALKWPNDVLANGAKLAGILLEVNKLPDGHQAIAIGLGVNLIAAPQGLSYPATSLRDLGVPCSAEEVFEALSDAWTEVFGLWNDGRGIGDVLKHWRAFAAGIGAPVAVNQDDQVLRGIFESIDDVGRLIVRVEDDRRIAITAGDVHFGATASAQS